MPRYKIAIVYFFTFISCGVSAQTPITVSIVDIKGKPVPHAVIELDTGAFNVEVTQNDGELEQSSATMDQAQLAFFPHILAIQAGTKVNFPNSDNVQHHVYSFSEAKTFEIQLYRQNVESFIRFDKPGIAELGCNVHDWMLGYIYVAQTSLFAQTNEQGVAKLVVPKALLLDETKLSVWHPRMHEQDIEQTFTFTQINGAGTTLTIALTRKMYPPIPEFDDGGLSDY